MKDPWKDSEQSLLSSDRSPSSTTSRRTKDLRAATNPAPEFPSQRIDISPIVLTLACQLFSLTVGNEYLSESGAQKFKRSQSDLKMHAGEAGAQSVIDDGEGESYKLDYEIWDAYRCIRALHQILSSEIRIARSIGTGTGAWLPCTSSPNTQLGANALQLKGRVLPRTIDHVQKRM
jgi:hypothetical protein